MNNRGYLLVEISIAYVIMALALAALVPTFIMALKANKKTEKIQTAIHLSTELYEEIRLRKWDENTPVTGNYAPSPSVTLGPDAGETASDKRTFDDMDDFNNWYESGVRDPVMRSIAAFSGYTRTVTFKYVDASMNASVASTDYKHVNICTFTVGLSSVCITSLLTNR